MIFFLNLFFREGRAGT